MLLVLTTTPNLSEAEKLAKKIIEKKLAACVQVLPQMKSFYFWKGEVQNETEYLLLIKTLETKFLAIEEFIQTNHSYDVPEVVALSAEQVSHSYLKWITDCLS